MNANEIEPLLLRLLSSIILFRSLEMEDLVALLRSASKATFEADSVVFEEGYSGHSLYVVVSGKFEVFKHVEKDLEAHIAYVYPGEHFGEMALVTDNARMASVRAVEDSIVLRFTKNAIFGQPRIAVYLLKNIAALMCEHLTEMNQEVLLLNTTRVKRKDSALGAIP